MLRKILIPIYHYMFFYKERTRYNVKLLLFLKRKNKMKMLRFFLRNRLEKKCHIEISEAAQIGSLILPHPHNIVIGKKAYVGENCTLYQNVTIGQKSDNYPNLKDGVIVYPSATIVGGITVGYNAIVGANAVVLHDVPDNAIVAGNPAKIIKYRED